MCAHKIMCRYPIGVVSCLWYFFDAVFLLLLAGFFFCLFAEKASEQEVVL